MENHVGTVALEEVINLGWRGDVAEAAEPHR
jgi:hypothetical protein